MPWIRFSSMRIQHKLWFILLSLLLIPLLVTSIITTRLRTTAITSEADTKLMIAAHAARHMLPPDYHDRIIGPDSISPDEFELIVENNNRLCAETGLQYVWSVLVLDPQHIVFTSSTSPDFKHTNHLHAMFYELHSDPAAFDEALTQMTPCFSTFRNKWGWGRMVLIPERDSHGRVFMFGASVAMENLNTLIYRCIFFSASLALLTGIVSGLILYLFARSITAPLEQLSHAADKMAKGHLDVELTGGGGYEVEALKHSFNTMRAAIQKQMADLHVSEERYRTTAIQLAHDINERKRTQVELRKLYRQLEQAHDEERRRLARELHDSTSQHLAALLMNLDMMESDLPNHPPSVKRLWNTAHSLAMDCTNEIRNIAYLLHPPLLDQLGLMAAVRNFVDGFAQRSGIKISLQLPDDSGRLPPELELTVYRIIQEGMNNIYRHSKSLDARIKLLRDPTHIELEISDSGCGIPQNVIEAIMSGHASPGVGLAGIHERLRLLNGTLTINSSTRDTVLRATIPLPEEQP